MEELKKGVAVGREEPGRRLGGSSEPGQRDGPKRPQEHRGPRRTKPVREFQ